eukprot:13690066-Alexandrium_andersonii.AAC.1
MLPARLITELFALRQRAIVILVELLEGCREHREVGRGRHFAADEELCQDTLAHQDILHGHLRKRAGMEGLEK